MIVNMCSGRSMQTISCWLRHSDTGSGSLSVVRLVRNWNETITRRFSLKVMILRFAENNFDSRCSLMIFHFPNLLGGGGGGRDSHQSYSWESLRSAAATIRPAAASGTLGNCLPNTRLPAATDSPQSSRRWFWKFWCRFRDNVSKTFS